MKPKQEYEYQFDFIRADNKGMEADIKLLEKGTQKVVTNNAVNLDIDNSGKVANSNLDILNQAPSIYHAEKIINNTAIEGMKPVDSFEPFLDIFEEIDRLKEEAQVYYNENIQASKPKQKKSKSLGMSM